MQLANVSMQVHKTYGTMNSYMSILYNTNEIDGNSSILSIHKDILMSAHY